MVWIRYKKGVEITLDWDFDNGKRKNKLELEHELMKVEVKRAFEKHEKEMQEMEKRGKWVERLVYFIFFLAFIYYIIVCFVLTKFVFSDTFVRLLEKLGRLLEM